MLRLGPNRRSPATADGARVVLGGQSGRVLDFEVDSERFSYVSSCLIPRRQFTSRVCVFQVSGKPKDLSAKASFFCSSGNLVAKSEFFRA